MAKSTREKQLEATLREVMDLLLEFPSGIDYEADIDDRSPEDATAHTAGLIWQVCTKALKATGG